MAATITQPNGTYIGASEVINSTLSTATKSPFLHPFNDEEVALVASILIVLMILGFLGNVITIHVILSSKKLRNDKFMWMIFSLSCSDLASSSISWIFLFRRTWGFDDFSPVPAPLCKVFWASDAWTSFSTSSHILCFALLRLYAIRRPHQSRHLKILSIRIMASLLWIMSFISGFVPMFIFTKASKPDRQSDAQNARWPACTIDMHHIDRYGTYMSVAFPLFLYLPGIGVILLSLLIVSLVFMKARSASRGGESYSQKRMQKDTQAILQLMLIALLFLVGYVPISAYEQWSAQKLPNSYYYLRLDYWFGMSSYITLRFSETMNPVFYNLGSTKLRTATIKTINAKLGWFGKAAKVQHGTSHTTAADVSTTSNTRA